MIKALKAAMSRMLHGSGMSWWGGQRHGTRINFAREAGSLIDASVVMGPVGWVQRALPEARLTVVKTGRAGKIETLADHPLVSLIQKPNEFYGDIVLWWGVILSLLLDGNAYVMIVRNTMGRPAELWYIPHWLIEPKWDRDGGAYLTHYRYAPGGGTAAVDVDPDDVIHFRYGIDPRNIRKGLAPLAPALREIFMDNESGNFVSALLRNMGVPGVVISPKGGAMPTPDDVAATSAWLDQAFSGDRRGKPLVMGAPTEVSQFGFNPQQMNMSEARDIAEERVCALIGIPAAVVGFGSGLQSTKVGATMEEMRKLAWHNGVLPLARLIADELQRALLPQMGRSEGLSVEWDTSAVPALQENEDKETERWNKRVAGGWATVAEARSAMGLPVDASHEIYLRPINMIEVPARAARAGKGMRGIKARASTDAMKRGEAYALALQRQFDGQVRAFEAALVPLFKDLSGESGRAARKVLGAKAQKDDGDVVQRILAQLGIDAFESRLKQIYEAQYLEVAKAVAAEGERAGLGVSLPDEVARAVIAAGGQRKGLLDLEEQSRAAVYEALAEGRAAGDGAGQLAARIEAAVEGGPWGSAETRARVVARTETKFAQNISTIQHARAAGVEKFMVFDGRLGPGRSKPDHIERNGSIVSAAEATQMAEDEHPNGTLSLAPHFEE